MMRFNRIGAGFRRFPTSYHFDRVKRKAGSTQKESKGGTMEIGEIERRFGTLALEKGFITLDQLVEAMNSQVVENLELGTHTPIGTIMVQKGWLDVPQINEVLRALGKEEETHSGKIKEISTYQAQLAFRPAL
jgi:hypothetical protein